MNNESMKIMITISSSDDLTLNGTTTEEKKTINDSKFPDLSSSFRNTLGLRIKD